MKALVGLNGDGHFFVTPLTSYDKLLKNLMKDIQDGDAWDNAEFDKSKFSLQNMSEKKIIDFLYEHDFINRGNAEIVDI